MLTPTEFQPGESYWQILDDEPIHFTDLKRNDYVMDMKHGEVYRVYSDPKEGSNGWWFVDAIWDDYDVTMWQNDYPDLRRCRLDIKK